MRGTWLLVALAGAAPGLLAADLPRPLADTLTAVETAFRDGDGRALRKSFSSVTRVRVDLGALTGGAASFSAGQFQVVMEGVFAGRRTESLAIAEDGVVLDGATAYAQARWHHSAVAGGTDRRRDTLTLVLRLEDGKWRVVELRAGR